MLIEINEEFTKRELGAPEEVGRAPGGQAALATCPLPGGRVRQQSPGGKEDRGPPHPPRQQGLCASLCACSYELGWLRASPAPYIPPRFSQAASTRVSFTWISKVRICSSCPVIEKHVPGSG